MKFSASLAILLSALLLQGCVGAVVVGTAAVAAKTSTDPRTTGTQLDDTTLEVRVNGALAKDKELGENSRVIATAYQGRILLTGQVPTEAISQQAQQTALGVDGVQEVYNELRIGDRVTLGTTSNDTWITTKVRSQLLTSNTVKSTKVKVITENSEVFLLGLLTEQEGQAAAKIASHTKGVKKVTTVFTYL